MSRWFQLALICFLGLVMLLSEEQVLAAESPMAVGPSAVAVDMGFPLLVAQTTSDTSDSSSSSYRVSGRGTRGVVKLVIGLLALGGAAAGAIYRKFFGE